MNYEKIEFIDGNMFKNIIKEFNEAFKIKNNISMEHFQFLINEYLGDLIKIQIKALTKISNNPNSFQDLFTPDSLLFIFTEYLKHKIMDKEFEKAIEKLEESINNSEEISSHIFRLFIPSIRFGIDINGNRLIQRSDEKEPKIYNYKDYFENESK